MYVLFCLPHAIKTFCPAKSRKVYSYCNYMRCANLWKLNMLFTYDLFVLPRNKTIVVTIYHSIYRLKLISIKYRQYIAIFAIFYDYRLHYFLCNTVSLLSCDQLRSTCHHYQMQIIDKLVNAI